MSAPRQTRLLYLYTGNPCQSQMAEGWTRHLEGDQIDVCSAGIETGLEQTPGTRADTKPPEARATEARADTLPPLPLVPAHALFLGAAA